MLPLQITTKVGHNPSWGCTAHTVVTLPAADGSDGIAVLLELRNYINEKMILNLPMLELESSGVIKSVT